MSLPTRGARLALLGVPAVIAIHCLQQKSRKLSISTLFLLERLAPDSREGRRFTWMRGSLAFWLQILCVLLLTWLLVEPRWMQANAVQPVVLVLDDSISMRAFTGDIGRRTTARLRAVSTLAPRTYWTVMETDPVRPTLYEGYDLDALESKLRTWNPSLPANDPTHALGLARAIAARDALVIFLTDRPHEIPSGVDLLAIGEPLENCGLVGLRLTGTGRDLEWQIMAQNYGRAVAHRSWWLEIAGRKTDAESIDLEPGHAKLLSGKFPPNVDRLQVCLEPDRFAVDDRMPIVRPVPKQLTVEVHGDEVTSELFTRLTQTLASLTPAPAGTPADLAFDTLGPHSPFPATDVSSIVLYNNPGAANAMQAGPFIAEDDPLNQDINWQALIMQPGPPSLPSADHKVLLWKDGVPLIYLRRLAENRQQLVFNFNFATSNAARLPAFVLLINRFVESLRSDKRAPETRNVELAESFNVAGAWPGPPLELKDETDLPIDVPAGATVPLRAPSLPGFFTVAQGGTTLVTGAAQFADARESDFSTATTRDTLGDRHARLVQLHTTADAMGPLWLLLVGALLLLYWAVSSPRIA